MEDQVSAKANGRGKKGNFSEAVHASAEADKAAAKETAAARKFMLDLPVKLSPEQRIANSESLVARRLKLDERKEEHKEAGAKLREDEKSWHDDYLLSGKGEAIQPVECVERLVFEQNEAHTVRLDTGEVVADQTRALDAEDRTGDLFDENEADA